MKGFRIHSLAIRSIAFAAAIGVCAFYAPWWGTPIVAGVSYLVFRLPTRTICALTFIAWFVACAGRDTLNGYGPSRVFAKMLSIQSVGFPNDSTVSRLCVYGVAGLIGFLLALFTGGTLKSLIALLPMKLRPQKALR